MIAVPSRNDAFGIQTGLDVEYTKASELLCQPSRPAIGEGLLLILGHECTAGQKTR